jgi:hypothetical protein
MTVYIIGAEGHPVATIPESVPEHSRVSGNCKYSIDGSPMILGKISPAKKWSKYLCLPEASCFKHRVYGRINGSWPAEFTIQTDELRY